MGNVHIASWEEEKKGTCAHWHSATNAIAVRKERETLSGNIHKSGNRYSTKNKSENSLFMDVVDTAMHTIKVYITL